MFWFGRKYDICGNNEVFTVIKIHKRSLYIGATPKVLIWPKPRRFSHGAFKSVDTFLGGFQKRQSKVFSQKTWASVVLHISPVCMCVCGGGGWGFPHSTAVAIILHIGRSCGDVQIYKTSCRMMGGFLFVKYPKNCILQCGNWPVLSYCATLPRSRVKNAIYTIYAYQHGDEMKQLGVLYAMRRYSFHSWLSFRRHLPYVLKSFIQHDNSQELDYNDGCSETNEWKVKPHIRCSSYVSALFSPSSWRTPLADCFPAPICLRRSSHGAYIKKKTRSHRNWQSR